MIPKLLKLIGVLTALTGAVQLVAPALILGLLDADRSLASMHFFSIVGMFMVLFGGLLFNALHAGDGQRIPIFWAALQKLGASAAVAIGVARMVFSPVALVVAGFDLLTAILAFVYWHRLGAKTLAPR